MSEPTPDPSPPDNGGGGGMISPWVFIAIGVLLLIIAAIAFFADDKTWNRIVALVTLIFGSGIFLFGAARAGMFGVGIQNRV